MILSTSGLDYETIRKLVLDVLKEGNFSQYGDIKNQVANKLVEYGYSTESNSFSLSYSPNYRELSNQDSDKVNQVVWDLIIDRVLTIGLNKSNENWPFLRLTDYGKNIINETDNVIVYDIDGMLQLIK